MAFQSLTVVAGAVGKVEIPPLLRDFQAEWESPASGLFHVAPFSTALLTHRFCYRAKKEVELKEIEKKWNSMTSLMDRMEFNRFFSSQAKDRDWVESKKRGFYRLRPSWKGIFEV